MRQWMLAIDGWRSSSDAEEARWSCATCSIIQSLSGSQTCCTGSPQYTSFSREQGTSDTPPTLEAEIVHVIPLLKNKILYVTLNPFRGLYT